ncbi:MAG: pilus assembly protein [Bacillota bacterium]|nr:pilus assembly protein [Bacillota bacterium]
MRKLNEKGNIAIILCLVVVSLFAFTAFVVDIGIVYVDKAQLTDAIDSAALASSLELTQDSSKAYTVANDYLSKNNVQQGTSSVIIGSDKKSIQIKASKNIKYIFAPIIGIKEGNINCSTKAVIAPLKSVTGGIRPFAVEKYNYSYGDVVTLKNGAGSGYNGNYGALALGGTGANVFRNNTLYGYSGTVSVGDYISTEPGNMAGVISDISDYLSTEEVENFINSENSTVYNFPRNSIRLWTIPLVDSMQVNGREQVLVIGFAEFYVETVGKNAGKMEITGRFVRYVIKGKIDDTLSDTGAYGAKLTRDN